MENAGGAWAFLGKYQICREELKGKSHRGWDRGQREQGENGRGHRDGEGERGIRQRLCLRPLRPPYPRLSPSLLPALPVFEGDRARFVWESAPLCFLSYSATGAIRGVGHFARSVDPGRADAGPSRLSRFCSKRRASWRRMGRSKTESHSGRLPPASAPDMAMAAGVGGNAGKDADNTGMKDVAVAAGCVCVASCFTDGDDQKRSRMRAGG